MKKESSYSVCQGVDTYVEIVVRHGAHRTEHPSHFEFGLVVHISDQLLSEAKVRLELLGLQARQIRPLL